MLGGVAGAAIAAGPLIGGWVTTDFSWRYVFAGEAVVVIGILLVRRQMKRGAEGRDSGRSSTSSARRSRRPGSGWSCSGSCKTSEWGWIQPRGALTINGHEITPFGFSVVPFLILGGLGAARLLLDVAGAARAARGSDALLDRALLRIVHLRAGLSTLLMQQLILLGMFFVLPVYLQVVLGLRRVRDGQAAVPDVGRDARSRRCSGPRLAARPFAEARLRRPGSARSSIGAFVLLGTIDVELNEPSSRSRWRCSGSAPGCCSPSSGT